jgi:hypothetical protein
MPSRQNQLLKDMGLTWYGVGEASRKAASLSTDVSAFIESWIRESRWSCGNPRLPFVQRPLGTLATEEWRARLGERPGITTKLLQGAGTAAMATTKVTSALHERIL